MSRADGAAERGGKAEGGADDRGTRAPLSAAVAGLWLSRSPPPSPPPIKSPPQATDRRTRTLKTTTNTPKHNNTTTSRHSLVFSYEILTPAALNFFVSYADGAVESLWSIDQYFQFVLVLMLSTGLSFQVPVIQVMLGQLGVLTSEQMFGLWRYVVVGSTVVAAVLTPSTDPFTQALLAAPLCGLYMGGAAAVRLLEQRRAGAQQA